MLNWWSDYYDYYCIEYVATVAVHTHYTYMTTPIIPHQFSNAPAYIQLIRFISFQV